MSTFESPGTATGIQWSDHLGALLIVDVHEVVKDVNTVHGITDAVRADVSVVDGPQAGEVYRDTLIFPKVLVAQTRSSVGKKVLGRLGQGQAKGSQSAPWKLADATPQDIEAATKALVSQPAPATAGDESPF